MKDYIICCDVSTDIDLKTAKENNVVFIQMEYTIGNETFMCSGTDDEKTINDFYKAQRKGIETKTTQITPYIYEEFAEKYLKEGTSILYLSLSSGLSNTYNSAILAANNLSMDYEDAKFEVIDSLNATAASGILLERMIENKNKGMSLEENKADIEKIRNYVAAEFMEKDLMYLKRGGRIGAATAAIGTVLNIRPMLLINDEGKLITFDKKKGDNSSVKLLVERYARNADRESNLVYVGGSDSKELQEYLKELILKENPKAVIKQVTLSPIIGAHTGPGMVFMVYLRKETKEHA